MDDGGFIRLARKFFRSDLWKEKREFSRAEAWLDMIATATFAPETRLVEGRCVSLQRGDLVASLRYLAERWSWSKSKVERFLSALVDAERIRDRVGTGLRIITLCNYDAYNPVRDAIETATGPPAGHSRDKVKEHEEEKKGIFILSGSDDSGGEKEASYHPDARAALHILNEQAGRHYRETDSNLTIISARLRESGVDIDGVRKMIQRQAAKWKGTEFYEYIRPETLFAKSKFDAYYAARELPINRGNQPHRNDGLVGGVDPDKAARTLDRRQREREAQAAGQAVGQALASEVAGPGKDLR